MHAAGGAERCATVLALEQRHDRGGESTGADLGHENAGAIVLHDVRQSAGLERDDRRLAKLCLYRDETQTLADRRYDERGGRAVKVGQAPLWQRTVPPHAIANTECTCESFQRFAILAIANDVERDGTVRDPTQGVQQELDPFLPVEPSDEQQPIVGSVACGREQLGGNRHGRHDRRRRGDDLLRLRGEPARDRRYDRRPVYHVPKARAGECNGSRQPHVASVECRDERLVGKPAEPRTDEAIGEPPVRVHDVGAHFTSHVYRATELRPEKAKQRDASAPRGLDLLGHGPGIGESLEAPWRVVESSDFDTVERCMSWQVRSGRRHDSRLDPFVLECTGESQHERAWRVAITAWKRVGEKEDFHTAYRCGRSLAISSSCRRISRSCARSPAICSPSRPVAKKMLPTIRHV